MGRWNTGRVLKGRKAEKEVGKLCNDMYEEGVWPKDFSRVAYMIGLPLQKKNNAIECGDHRKISLISHASKNQDQAKNPNKVIY